jgi:hypothetical protein
MVDRKYIGLTIYSKKLDRNFDIIDGPNDEYWKSVGLESVLVQVPKKEKQKFPKVDPDTANDEQ